MNKIPLVFLFTGLLTIGSALAQSPYTTNSNTLLLYHFDEDAGTTHVTDSSGNNRHGTRGDADTAGGDALPGMGYAHRPAGTVFPVPENNARRTNWTDPNLPGTPGSLLYEIGSQEYTIEMWVQFNDLNISSGGTRYLMSIQSGTTVQPDFSIGILKHGGDGKFYLALGDAGGPNRVWSSGAPLSLTVGEWYHIAVTATPTGVNQSTYRFYFNTPGSDISPDPIYTNVNTFMTPSALPVDGPAAARRLEIGNYFGSNGQAYFRGQIDEFRISDVALTTFETLQPIPEPSQVALVLAGACFLLGRTCLSRKSK